MKVISGLQADPPHWRRPELLLGIPRVPLHLPWESTLALPRGGEACQLILQIQNLQRALILEKDPWRVILPFLVEKDLAEEHGAQYGTK